MFSYTQKRALAFMLGVLLGAGAFYVPLSLSTKQVLHTQSDRVAYYKAIGTETQQGIAQLIAEGRYKCCLESPCAYCFTDTEHQDRQMVCNCVDDIVNGKAPCGECLGEILEGEGNELLAEYFAQSIADELGAESLPLLRQYVEEVYGIPVSAQL